MAKLASFPSRAQMYDSVLYHLTFFPLAHQPFECLG
jgi:hypothetical protein